MKPHVSVCLKQNSKTLTNTKQAVFLFRQAVAFGPIVWKETHYTGTLYVRAQHVSYLTYFFRALAVDVEGDTRDWVLWLE